MDLRRRIERLEKEVKNLKGEQEGVFILVTEYAFNKEDEERMKRYQEELLEKLKEYPETKVIIAFVDSKGWQFQLPELGIKVHSSGEVYRYKEG
jgi:hypothetical protein